MIMIPLRLFKKYHFRFQYQNDDARAENVRNGLSRQTQFFRKFLSRTRPLQTDAFADAMLTLEPYRKRTAFFRALKSTTFEGLCPVRTVCLMISIAVIQTAKSY